MLIIFDSVSAFFFKYVITFSSYSSPLFNNLNNFPFFSSSKYLFNFLISSFPKIVAFKSCKVLL